MQLIDFQQTKKMKIMKKNKSKLSWIIFTAIAVLFSACKSLNIQQKDVKTQAPVSYNGSQDTSNIAALKWKDYFQDQNLISLIDTALANNQELNIMMQEISVLKNEIQAKRGEYLPFMRLGVGGGGEKVGRYTTRGSSEATTDIAPGKATPEFVPDMMIGAYANWEVDIWHKLRNAKKSAATRYLSSVEGKNFMVTNLISEIANSYYELLALDNRLEILKQNIEIQTNALEIVKLQKSAGKVTELAVKKFEAGVYNTKSHQFSIRQEIVETQNRINFLVGRFPQPVTRNLDLFKTIQLETINAGIPSQLLENRTDIRQAGLDLEAAKFDIKVAKAEFYPSLNISAGLGFQAFNLKYFVKTPESMLFSMIGDLAAPLINRNAIKAKFYNANAKQIQAVYNYEKTVLNAFIEVSNQLSNIDNLKQGFDLKEKEVNALIESTTIAGDLFKSARADYMEVLMTQRDALESRFELIETRKLQLNAKVNIYKALGGGWK
jgi:NodT family efflux transporter outer membrane factor (OMF) lipoprotein